MYYRISTIFCRILAKISQVAYLRPLAPIFTGLLCHVFRPAVNSVVENTNIKGNATSCRIKTRHIPYAQTLTKMSLETWRQDHCSYTCLKKKKIHTKATVSGCLSEARRFHVSFVLGFPPPLNPAVQNTTCTLHTDTDSTESWDLAHETIAVVSAIKTHTYRSNGTAIYYFDASSPWRSDSHVNDWRQNEEWDTNAALEWTV